MDRELYKKFNEEVNRHRNSLLFYARKCDWNTFKVNAGRLFDYVESVEISVMKSKFLKITKAVVTALLFMIIIIFKMNPDIYPELARVNELLTLIAIATCCFEVYFLYNFRIYLKGKRIYYGKRREKFISSIERDFKDIKIQVAA